MVRPGHPCDTTDSASAIREDCVMLRTAASTIRQHQASTLLVIGYAKRLQILSQSLRLELKRATSSMKKKVSQIEEALGSVSQETILDDPEKFQASIESLEKDTRRYSVVVIVHQ